MDLLIACGLDLVFGDPHWLPHPVRFIGALIKRLENALHSAIHRLAPTDNHTGRISRASLEKAAGFVLLSGTAGITVGIAALLLWAAEKVHPLLFHTVNIYLLYTSLAAKCLAAEAMKVYRSLTGKNLRKAREQLAMLVGRDTRELPEAEIIRGVVETTAENTVDGVLSPLFFALMGSLLGGGWGAVAVYAFKAVSTLDSMVGYKNEKYLHLGMASARADDLANYIPARISGMLLPLAAFFTGKSMKNSIRILFRDHRNHPSPNSPWPESAVAGALGVRLGGLGRYEGVVVQKPYIGDATRDFRPEDIPAAVRIMIAAEMLFVLAAFAVGAALTAGTAPAGWGVPTI
ncbi:MAG TPA: cobalamin biosynthesis protein CobD [Clostridiales bacterium]|nr:cobalamin biosynthesis protein CobD [Clostridiales bacterium]